MALPPVPLTPADVDLMSHPEVLVRELRRLAGFFERFGIDWYIQSSLAARIYGLVGRSVTDIDVRADWPMEDLYCKAREHLDGRARLRPPVSYGHGEFRNQCMILDIDSPRTHIDVTTEIHTYRSPPGVLFRVPFDDRAVQKRVHPDLPDRFPVCSLEYLVIYKLIHCRGGDERKNDLAEAAVLLAQLGRPTSSP